jgi:hypothetical protein
LKDEREKTKKNSKSDTAITIGHKAVLPSSISRQIWPAMIYTSNKIGIKFIVLLLKRHCPYYSPRLLCLQVGLIVFDLTRVATNIDLLQVNPPHIVSYSIVTIVSTGSTGSSFAMATCFATIFLRRIMAATTAKTATAATAQTDPPTMPIMPGPLTSSS